MTRKPKGKSTSCVSVCEWIGQFFIFFLEFVERVSFIVEMLGISRDQKTGTRINYILDEVHERERGFHVFAILLYLHFLDHLKFQQMKEQRRRKTEKEASRE